MPYHIAPEIIIDGTLYTLLAFSIATWTVILFKTWEFTNNNYRNRRFNKAFWDASGLAQAESVPASTAIGPQARIAHQGFTWLNESQLADGKHLKYISSPAELLEHSLLIQMQKEQHRMESGLTLLASIGSTSPFVGLFGTVLGIMHAMHEITASGSTSLNVVAGPTAMPWSPPQSVSRSPCLLCWPITFSCAELNSSAPIWKILSPVLCISP